MGEVLAGLRSKPNISLMHPAAFCINLHAFCPYLRAHTAHCQDGDTTWTHPNLPAEADEPSTRAHTIPSTAPSHKRALTAEMVMGNG